MGTDAIDLSHVEILDGEILLRRSELDAARPAHARAPLPMHHLHLRFEFSLHFQFHPTIVTNPSNLSPKFLISPSPLLTNPSIRKMLNFFSPFCGFLLSC